MEQVGVSGWRMSSEKSESAPRKPFEKHPLTLEDGGYVLDITVRQKNGTNKVRSQPNVKFPMQYMNAVIEKNQNLVEISCDGEILWHCDSPRAIKHLDNWSTRNQ